MCGSSGTSPEEVKAEESESSDSLIYIVKHLTKQNKQPFKRRESRRKMKRMEAITHYGLLSPPFPLPLLLCKWALR